ncbi:hypothetical protein KDH02_004789, partial [Salmonella enterica]|nr:hypothetical protein [Salmonella enterica]
MLSQDAKKTFSGMMTEEQFTMLIDISSIRSTKVIQALKDYFVIGKKRGVICELHNVNQGYLSIKIREVLNLYKKILKMNLYLQGLVS